MRIACYGFAEKGAGSLAGANYLVLEELLRRGVEVDFFGWKGFVEPTQLCTYKNFRFIAIQDKTRLRTFLRFIHNLPGIIDRIAHILFLQRMNFESARYAISNHHAEQPYELLLILGLCTPFKKIAGLPIVTWMQGIPGVEWSLIEKNKDLLIQLAGWPTFWKIKFYYRWINPTKYANLRDTDRFICCSTWSSQQLEQRGISANHIFSIPYPFDTSRFNVAQGLSTTQKKRQKTLLYLGRIDARKRLDLLLDAYKLLLQERKDVHLKIIGSTSYCANYKQLIDHFEYPEHLEYCQRLEREKVPALMAECTLLVQPSEGENFGSSVAEALCCGLPVVLGPTNGTKDYIGKAGFMFADYTPQALKETLNVALDAVTDDRLAWAQLARQTAEEQFDVAGVVDQLQRVFRQLPHRSTTITQPALVD